MRVWLKSAPYIQLSRNRVYRYRRVIPKPFRAKAGRWEIVTSLGTKDPKVAELRYLKTHLLAEEWLRSITSSDEAASEIIQPLPYPFVQVADSRPPSRQKRLAAEKLALTTISLSEGLRIYFDEKRTEFGAYTGRDRTVRYNEKSRFIAYLIDALGSDRDVGSLTRQDARTFRDYLVRKGLRPASIGKTISIVAAIVQVALVEKQIAIRNPFHRFHVVNDVAAIDARLPLTDEEMAIARSLNVNAELSGIVNLLALTGARLNEMAGLQWDDVVVADSPNLISHLHIRSNPIRRLKTASSRRTVPLLPDAIAIFHLARLRAVGQPGSEDAVFPRYGRPGGADAVSQALMKSLRKAGVTDRRKSIHSIRHSVKQALRDVGCPKDVRDAIQGHASNDMAENYGTGHSLRTMMEWLLKISTK